MANTVTLTNLAPEIYKAADIVARELVGAVRGVMLNTADADGVNAAAFGDKIKSLRTPSTTPTDSFTPQMVPSDATDKSATFDEFALDKTAKDDLPLIGETTRRLNQAGSQAETFRVNTFAQIMRSVVNQIEANLLSVGYKASSRAVGAAGTTPFASNQNLLNSLRKVLVDNGCPQDDLQFVMDTSAGLNLRNLSNLQKINESGSPEILRNGMFGLPLSGFAIRESAGVASHTKGTGAAYDVDLVAGYDPGDTTIHIDTGTGTVLAGDVVDFGADKYVVGTGFAGDGDGDIVLNRPGLTAALADGTDLVIADSYTANLGFHRNAIECAVRSADMGDDAAVETLMVTDPISGIPFEFRRYAGEGMSKIMVVVHYGAKVWKPEFVATLLG